MRIRVFIVSNVRLLREGLETLLRGCPSIEVLGANSVQEAHDALPTTTTDVALVDSLSSGDSDVVMADMVVALRNLCTGMRIVAFGIRETGSEVLACAAAGVDGYVPMDAALGDMVTAIANRTAMAVANPLTTRELQVADLMNRGCPTKEIAWRLGVRPCTAKNHIRNILHKLRVRRRGQAVAKLRTLIGEHFGVGEVSHG